MLESEKRKTRESFSKNTDKNISHLILQQSKKVETCPTGALRDLLVLNDVLTGRSNDVAS